ncbi:MAG: glycosyltransferase, partial [Opitutae bacterium]
QQLIAEYDNACVFVYPSLAEQGETFGLSALEAMSRGCLTLVSDLDCFKDFISHGQNGFIFNHRTENPANTLVKHLTRLLKSPEDYGNIAVNAVAKAQSYSPALVAKSFLADFDYLIN